MIFDLIIFTDQYDCIEFSQWMSDADNALVRWSTLLKQGLSVAHCLGIEANSAQGKFSLDGERFHYQRMPRDGGGFQLYCKREDVRYHLMQAALERTDSGVQIYDGNGVAVFFNHISRKISSIPEHTVLEGKHLTELYDLDPEISTVLTSLRIGAPVRNRIDTFGTFNGQQTSSSNSAYPVRLGGKVIGSVLFEHDADTLTKQIERLDALRKSLKNHNGSLIGHKFNGYSFNDILYQSEEMANAVAIARRFAAQSANVLLVGETGTGKELFAQSIHKASSRNTGKFIAINCAAVPDTLIESLLFGTKKGSFTGSEERIGLFEEATHGTLFLDELNSMSAGMQAKLLRVVQEGVFRRVGDNSERKVDVRIVSSCNERPEVMISDGKFRRDLFYRLSTVQVEIPPLRSRTGDIAALATGYIQQNSGRYAKHIRGLSTQALEILERYHWPGNVRELYHVLDFALNVTEGDFIKASCLPEYLHAKTRVTGMMPHQSDIIHEKLEDIMGEYEAAVLKQVLEHYGGNISQAANSLGICRQTLSYRIRKYGLII